jgi:hypothetical protein
VEKIKRQGLTTKDWDASVKGKSEAQVWWTIEAVKLEQGTYTNRSSATGEEQAIVIYELIRPYDDMK